MDITWITGRIAVGGGIWHSDAKMLEAKEAGITHIINMQSQSECDDTDLAAKHGIELLSNGTDDDFMPKPPEIFEKGVKFAREALEDPKAKLFIHCAAGVHRAPMMTLAILGPMGRTLEEARDFIEDKRSVADFPDVYVQSVREFLTSLTTEDTEDSEEYGLNHRGR